MKSLGGRKGADLGIDVLREVVGQEVVIAAGGNGGHHGLKKVIPPKLSALDQVCHPLIPRIQLQSRTVLE